MVIGHHSDGRPLVWSDTTYKVELGGRPISLNELFRIDDMGVIDWVDLDLRQQLVERYERNPDVPGSRRHWTEKVSDKLAFDPGEPGAVKSQPTNNRGAHPKSRVQQYHRTCSDCGHSWFIPKALADEKLPKKSEIRAAKMMSLGTGFYAGIGRRGQTDAINLEQQKARVLENARCPSCGSTRFRQT